MRLIYLTPLLFVVFSLCAVAENPALELRYDAPASDWMTEALPIGNAYMGAMFFGAPEEEHIQFSEGSLWAGGPGSNPAYNFGNREGAAAHLEEVRALIRAGKRDEAHALANRTLTGVIHKKAGSELDFGDYGAQQTMGDVFVSVAQDGPVLDYHRSLDLDQALGEVQYQSGNVRHRRTFFGSYPDQVLVYRFENDNPAGAQYEIRIETSHSVDTLEADGKSIRLQGHILDNGLGFETRLLLQTDGSLAPDTGGHITVMGARTLTLYHIAGTAYRNVYPTYRGTDYVAQNDAFQQRLTGIDYATLWQSHISDYQRLFQRVSLRIGGAENDAPTDTRLQNYQQGRPDPALEVLLFQFARYCTIAASRPGALPMHLQGKWNNSTNPPWAADYHTDINEQMLYWPAEVTNLPECHEPLLDYIATLVEPGRVSAKTHFGTRGWVVNTMNNAFGFTAPGWDFPWGYYPAGAAWLCQHLWEHYAFTQDEAFLLDHAYPVMKEAALFWIDYLQKNDAGELVSIPSYSPEHGGISAGASMDHQIAWELLNNCVNAAEVLGTDKDFRLEAARVRDQICKPAIGHWGQLQEWIEDVDDPQDHHRHVSHLYALYPGTWINPTQTPAWAEAARTSLEARGDDGTGWSLAWKICFWARLHDGDHAYRMLRKFLRLTRDKKVVMNNAGGVYPNLFCAHPPFQLDGNMGAAAGIAEMLLQSHAAELHLLPALPSQWPDGEVSGLVARGGYTVDIEWDGGKLTRATVHAPKAGSIPIRYGDHVRSVELKEGENILDLDVFNLESASAPAS